MTNADDGLRDRNGFILGLLRSLSRGFAKGVQIRGCWRCGLKMEIIMMLAGLMRMKVIANSVTRILALSSHFCRPQRWHPTFSPRYDLSDQTNQIFSESLWHPLSTDPPTTYPSNFLTNQTHQKPTQKASLTVRIWGTKLKRDWERSTFIHFIHYIAF